MTSDDHAHVSGTEELRQRPPRLAAFARLQAIEVDDYAPVRLLRAIQKSVQKQRGEFIEGIRSGKARTFE